ncbi:MAG: sensor histidine kinase [Syntrophomonas sp.]|nr:sensor histidine kinase [Syntrophomonas sp.]
MNDEIVKYDHDEIQQERLDSILRQVLGALEGSRQDIYDIAEECRKQCENLQIRLEEAVIEAARLIEKVDKCERLEKMARVRLMEVSRNFRAFSEVYIKEVYQSALTKQNELIELRQQELYLRSKRDELNIQLKKFEAITNKAEGLLHNTTLALKVFEANVVRVSDTLDDVQKKQQITLWNVESLEAQRRKIARELHDGPAQTMASMLLRLDLVEYLFKQDTEKTMAELLNIRDMGRESLNDIRRIMFDLKPSALKDFGLAATLKDYFDDYESKYNFSIELICFGQARRYGLALEIALFRLVQEAIANARKHAGVNKAMVKMEEKGTGLTLVIKDEGWGFNVDEAVNSGKDSYGILGMKERAELFGGRISIISNPGKGTQVIVEIPAEREENNGHDKDINC